MMTRRLKALNIISALTILLLVLLTNTADACSCMPTHPQVSYCNADYVIIARILRKLPKLVNNNYVYKIETKKTYKKSNETNNYLKPGRILSPKSESVCGYPFKVGGLYVIAGRKEVVRLCDYVREYKSMTIVERRGFSGAYRKGCACQINTCFSANCPLRNNTCRWSPFARCETSYGACVPYRNSLNKCHWRRSPPYKNCIHNP